MRNCKDLFQEIQSHLTLNETLEEIESVVYALLSDLFNITRVMVLSDSVVEWTPVEQEKLVNALKRLNTGEPVQYVAGRTYFYGHSLIVTPDVLIPRPETEELTTEVIRFVNSATEPEIRILDIGTGSGCIPVTLALEVPNVTVIATDVSDKALAVARQNALSHRVAVQLLQHNILTQAIPFKDLSVIVSNPPYIALSEKSGLSENVVNFEPHLALFVDDEDPLIFYRVIAEKARDVLVNNGMLIFEINERFGTDVADLLSGLGYARVEVLKDIPGKDRMVKCFKA